MVVGVLNPVMDLYTPFNLIDTMYCQLSLIIIQYYLIKIKNRWQGYL